MNLLLKNFVCPELETNNSLAKFENLRYLELIDYLNSITYN